MVQGPSCVRLFHLRGSARWCEKLVPRDFVLGQGDQFFDFWCAGMQQQNPGLLLHHLLLAPGCAEFFEEPSALQSRRGHFFAVFAMWGARLVLIDDRFYFRRHHEGRLTLEELALSLWRWQAHPLVDFLNFFVF